LRVLAVDEPAAEVVRRIFAEYLEGLGDRAIAAGLNRDSVPCPSARRPEQNTHRLADGWQGGTIKSILDNPRYTAMRSFGRWTKHETLLDPDDVAAGHVVRFRKSTPDRIVRSRRPAHPEIVSVEEFTQVQLLRKSRAASGMRGRAKLERTRINGTRPYVLRGLMRCGFCDRRMQVSFCSMSRSAARRFSYGLLPFGPAKHGLLVCPTTCGIPSKSGQCCRPARRRSSGQESTSSKGSRAVGRIVRDCSVAGRHRRSPVLRR
jgi:hypothetical protein